MIDVENLMEYVAVAVAVVTFLDACVSAFVALAGVTPWTWDDEPASAARKFMDSVLKLVARFSLLRNQKGNCK